MPLSFRIPLAGLMVSIGLVGAAPTAEAFDVTLWNREVSPTGTIFFQCKASACTPGSLVSFRVKGPDIIHDLATYERAMAGAYEKLAGLGVKVVPKPATQRNRGKFVEYGSSRTEIHHDGRRVYYFGALLVGHDISISVVSSSTGSSQAKRNFNDLADHLARHLPKERSGD